MPFKNPFVVKAESGRLTLCAQDESPIAVLGRRVSRLEALIVEAGFTEREAELFRARWAGRDDACYDALEAFSKGKHDEG